MEIIKLSDKGADEILKLLENPPEPNPYLIAAKKRHDHIVKNNDKDFKMTMDLIKERGGVLTHGLPTSIRFPDA